MPDAGTHLFERTYYFSESRGADTGSGSEFFLLRLERPFRPQKGVFK
jgi:hypothetical protein